MKSRVLLSTLGLFLAFPLVASEISGNVSRIGNATHLEFTGRKEWKYQIERQTDPRRLKIYLPPTTSEVRKLLENWKDNYIKDVSIDQNGLDGSHVVNLELTSPKIQYFDYVTDQPSRLIIDFFEPEENKSNKSQAAKATANLANPTSLPKKLPVKKTIISKTNPGKTKPIARKPAGTDYVLVEEQGQPQVPGRAATSDEDLLKSLEKGLFDGGDPEYRRFAVADYEVNEDAIIAVKKNIYIRLPMLDDRITGLEDLFARPIEYSINPTESEENKMARLLLTLYQNKRTGVFLRTLKFFREKYPTSRYDQVIDHITADTHYQIWEKERSTADFQQAVNMYESLVQKYPDSPLAERTEILVGKAFLDRGDSLGTLKVFERFLRERPSSVYTDPVRIIIARAYQRLNKYDMAYDKLSEIESNAKNPRFARMAGFLKGDIFFQKGDYQRSVAEYDAAIAKYKDHLQDQPNAFYNRAESLFWLGRYEESARAFRQFVVRFPSHSHNSYALTRIGEVMEILGVDKKRWMGAFFEGHYRYKGTDGAHVAWLRLLRKRMVGMKESEVASAVSQVLAAAKESQLPLIEDFTTLMLADGFFNRKDYSQALKHLIEFYQKNPTSTNLAVFEDRILRTITESIRHHVNNGEFLDALRVYGRHYDTWLRKSGRIDVKYFLGRSFETAGVYAEAAEVYQDALNNLKEISGTKAERERNVFEVLPTTDELNLRLAAVAVHLGQFAKGQGHLASIRSDAPFSDEQQLEKMQLAVAIAKASRNTETAKRYLTQLAEVWKNQPRKLSATLLELAKIQVDDKEFSDAENSLKKVLALFQDTQDSPKELHAKALELKGQLMQKMGRPNDAVTYYTKLLESYGQSEEFDPIRYETGKILFDMGRAKEADEVWAELNKRQGSVWQRIADDRRREQDWNKDYKKYIERIPAMADAGSAQKEESQKDAASKRDSEGK